MTFRLSDIERAGARARVRKFKKGEYIEIADVCLCVRACAFFCTYSPSHTHISRRLCFSSVDSSFSDRCLPSFSSWFRSLSLSLRLPSLYQASRKKESSCAFHSFSPCYMSSLFFLLSFSLSVARALSVYLLFFRLARISVFADVKCTTTHTYGIKKRRTEGEKDEHTMQEKECWCVPLVEHDFSILRTFFLTCAR